jgi:hypothetical protein
MLTRPSPSRARSRLLALAGALAFIASLAVHLATYAGINVSRELPAVWGLHVLAIALGFPMIRAIQRWLNGQRFRWRALAMAVPPWVRLAFPVLYAYALASFVLTVSQLPRSSETTAEYERRVGVEAAGAKDVNTLRLFSGLWLVFFALPGAFFFYVPPDARLSAPQDERADTLSRQAAV